MPKIKELKEKRATIFSEIDELRRATDGREMDAEEKAKWDKMLSDYDIADRNIQNEEKFIDIEKIQAEQNAKRKDTPGNDSNDQEYRSAFADYLINGESGIIAERKRLFEQRAGITGVARGVIVPKTLASTIEIALKGYGGMLEAGSIFTTSNGGDLTMPTINDTNNKAVIVAEYQKSTQSTPTFGSETMKAYTYRTPIIPVSLELLQDSEFDLDALLGSLLAESFGRGVNDDLTNGSGSGKPKGIMNWATASDAAPTATAIKLDDIIDLVGGVDSNYAKNGRFMFHRDTLYSLMKLKDTTGRYLWQEGTKDGNPSTLFGKPYILNDDMPTIGAGNASVLFGDFSKFKIRIVKDFRVIRLNEMLAEYLSIGLFGFARMDGILLDAGTHPVKKLVHSAS